jgi:hypothetical protein
MIARGGKEIMVNKAVVTIYYYKNIRLNKFRRVTFALDERSAKEAMLLSAHCYTVL